mgnify:CR=1 FL=1
MKIFLLLPNFQALLFLQRKGVCHRSICLENCLLDDNEQLVLIDAGLSLRVPYTDPYNCGGVIDVSGGSIRRLMNPQGQCGRLLYLAPEIIAQTPFDGHASDLWAIGVILFNMLIGVEPFAQAHPSDARFHKICQQGHLGEFLKHLGVSLSHEAIDLLQNMLWSDPRQRLTLADIMEHPWVLGQRIPANPVVAPAVDTERFRCEPMEDMRQEEDGSSQMVLIEAPKKEQPIIHDTDNTFTRKKSSARAMFGKLKCAFPRRITSKAHSVPKSQTAEVL